MSSLFSMSAIEGLYCVRQYSFKNNNNNFLEVREVLVNLNADYSSLDFEAAHELHLIIPNEQPILVPHLFYRHCLSHLILHKPSGWARSVTLGREKFLRQLERDELQCFRAAELTNPFPTQDEVEWWDFLAREIRHESDSQKLTRARNAEFITLEHEKVRLLNIGIELLPRWIAIDDNTAGYDVLSYDLGEQGPISRLIEVKSTISSPLRFYVTRNEWEKAIKFGDNYFFYVWDLAANPERLYERTVKQIQPHIPVDQAKGKWSIAEIPLSAQ